MFRRLTQRGPIAWVMSFWWRYEHHLNALALLLGFVFDLFLASRPDNLTNNILLLSYLSIAGATIIILNLRSTRLKEQEEVAPLFLLFVLQFCFGGLASNLFILYVRSGTLAASTLFFLILGSMIIANEFMRSRYAQLRFNIVVYYLLLLSYLVIALPTFVLHSVGVWQFLLSGAASLVFIAGFLTIIYYAVLRGRHREQQLFEVSVLVGLVFILFNALYFLNIIPPVPLSLKNIGIYHSVTRTAPSVYVGKYEPSPWYTFWRETSSTFTLVGSENATCFSSVFAPTGLTAPVFHRWEKYNEQTGKWTTVSRISFPISGGRDGGYRGWTLFSVKPGQWRCDVETESGALIGRISFDVLKASSTPAIATKTL